MRRKKARARPRVLSSESEGSDGDEPEEPFRDVGSESLQSRLSANPYANMSRIKDNSDEINTPVTPTRSQQSSRSSSFNASASTSPYRCAKKKLNFINGFFMIKSILWPLFFTETNHDRGY